MTRSMPLNPISLLGKPWGICHRQYRCCFEWILLVTFRL